MDLGTTIKEERAIINNCIKEIVRQFGDIEIDEDKIDKFLKEFNNNLNIIIAFVHEHFMRNAGKNY